MNRLILIGNGFDLAHKLPTSYNDFIFWYLRSCCAKAQEQGSYTDSLITIQTRYNWEVHFSHGRSFQKLLDYFFENNLYDLLVSQEFKINNSTTTYTNPLIVSFGSNFLQTLLIKCSKATWVDIENEYYEALKDLLSENSRKSEMIQQLNLSFTEIAHQLENYLGTLSTPQSISDYRQIFRSEIRKVDVISENFSADHFPKKSLILNFNYTSTIDMYRRDSDAEVNFIHGKIGDIENPIIFGFGDELDVHYEKMELEKVKGFFTHIKSFGYFRTVNYHQLIRFIESDQYQIFVMGHSCGLSDRTMLNMVFEHENCMSIKIFYHETGLGKNNFIEQTQEISRHFRNKGLMRKKIVPFPLSSPMPQAN